MKDKQRKYLYMTIPALLLVAAFIGAPILNAVRLSFYRWNGYSQVMRFDGLENYLSIFSDRMFWAAARNTLIYGFGSMLLQNVLGLSVALFLNTKFRGRNALRAIVYLPIMIAAFLMGQIAYYLVQYDGGVLNDILAIFNFAPVYWMQSGLSATVMITLVNSWQYAGLCMVIYLAGLQNIPGMYSEAARLDGANKVKEFTNVTLPLLIPSITTAVVTNLIGGLKMYDVIVSMSGGGPSRGSLSLSYYISLLYFNDEKAGYASAVGIVMFLMILIITAPINKFLQKKAVEY